MSKHCDEILELFRGGTGTVAVYDGDYREYLGALRGAELAGPSGQRRAVVCWDAEDGFTPPADYSDPLPDATELTATLEYILSYRGEAVFVLDCREVDWQFGAARLRKIMKHLAIRDNQAPALVLMIVDDTIPTALSKKITCVGTRSVASAQETQPAAPPARKVADEYHDLRDIDKFDSPEWAGRLGRMAADEVERIVESGAYRDPLERVRELCTTLKGRFARKDSLIDSLCSAAIAQVPAVLIGPPGTAKSQLVRCFCEGLGLTAQQQSSDVAKSAAGSGRSYFEYLLTRYTTPEEIYGPIHVKDLIDRNVYRRVTDGYLPQAHIAFLDEIFKASSAILNTLLTLLNERIFYNGGLAERVPLMMVFAASNEAPTDENLQALYDRFPLRFNCPPVDDEHVGELLNAAWQQAYDRQFAVRPITVNRCACANDLRLLRHVSRVRYGGSRPAEAGRAHFDFEQEFLRFFRSLRGDFAISDRTSPALLAFCRAQCLLKNQSELTVTELDVFKYVAWDESGTGELDRLVNNMKRGIRL